jgi:hypothetical protein
VRPDHLSFFHYFICFVQISTLVKSASIDQTLLTPEKAVTPFHIDGILDEPAWQKPCLETTFRTYNPTYGEPLPFKTHVWMSYDDENLYFAFRCEDAEPDKIKTSISQRDAMFSDDWVGLSLDALRNKQVSYDLFVNASGIQGDILDSAVSGEDVSPDFIWDSAGKLVEGGYQVEMRVPLKSIRFKSGEQVQMGLLFWRKISRLGMSGAWPELKPGTGIFDTHATVVYNGLKNPLNLEILPSMTVGSTTERQNPQKWSDSDVSKDLGIGFKYGLTSSMVAEGTYNPDFSQVESDAFQAEVNRRYPVFYQEKRPFFMEGMDIFQFAIIPHGYMSTAVHTRQIVDPRWGGKMTGSIGKSTFGIIAAGDEYPGYRWEDEVNPNQGQIADFGILRIKRSLDSDNYYGLIYSGRIFDNASNQVVGGDFQYRLFKNQQAALSVLNSSTQNPDTKKYQNGANVNFWNFWATEKYQIAMAFEHYDKRFQMDSAFLTRTAINNGWLYGHYTFYPKKIKWIKRIQPDIIFNGTHDTETRMNDYNIISELYIRFYTQASVSMDVNHFQECWAGQAFHGTIWDFNGSAQFTKWLQCYANFSTGRHIYYSGDPAYLGRQNSLSLGMTLQPGTKWNQSFDFYREDFYRLSDHGRVYTAQILNSRTTYQFNKYFFTRAILRYNSFDQRILTDVLASFTWIPGTVVHLGYGSIYEKADWHDEEWNTGGTRYHEMRRGLFFKASYLWRVG